MKFCKDCKYCRRSDVDKPDQYEFSKCTNIKTGDTRLLVDGISSTFCSMMRESSSLFGRRKCGIDALWFEPRDGV